MCSSDLHNHARLWLASYAVHWRRLRWQLGARWFHAHLLDADGASNSLSWQWVASSFSAKPYIFNRANLERFAGDSLCRQCPLASGGCPFDASYEALQERLFGAATPAAPGAVASGGPGEPSRGGTERHATESEPPREPATPGTGSLPAQPVLWIHAEDLSPRNAALLAHPHRPALFVFDPEAIEAEPWGLKRLLFLHDCLLELPVKIGRAHV